MIINAPVNASLNITIFKQGDFTPFDLFTTVITNTRTTFFRSFGNNGTYVVNASFDYYGYSKQKNTNFSVIGSQLIASIDVDEDFVKVGKSIHFNAIVSNNISSVSYKWDFTNDGSVDSTTKEVDYAYNTRGSKTVNLTVEDSLKRVSTTRVIDVREEFKLHFTVLENSTDIAIKNATVELDNKKNYTNDNGELDWYVLNDSYALAVLKDRYYSHYEDLNVDENKSLTIRLNKRNRDITPPQITLISPEDNKVINANSVDLRFKVIDGSSFNCTVFYSEYANWYKPLEINKSMANNTETVVGLSELVVGKNYWKVECVDVFGNRGVSNSFVFNVELPTTEQNLTKGYEGEDEIGIFSNNVMKEIDSTLNSINSFAPNEKDVAEAIDLRKHLDESKNKIQRVRSDIHNLQFLGLTPTEEANEREKLRKAVEDIEESTIKGISVSNKAEYTRYPLDDDIGALSTEFLSAKNISLSKGQREEFIKKNKDVQSLITVSTEAWSAELEYISGDRETITLVEKTVYINGDYNGYSIVEFIPKSVVDDINKVEFITTFSTIKSDPIAKVGLNKDNRSIYYIKGGVSLADIDKINTLLIYDNIESFATKSKVTGFVVLENFGGVSNVVVIVLLFLVLIVGYVMYQQDVIKNVDVPAIRDLREKIQSRKDISRIRELVDVAYIRIRNNQLKDARFAYGEINLIYRKIPESCRKVVYNDIIGLSKQIDIHHLYSLIYEVQNSLRYNQIESTFEIYNKIKVVYKNFDKHQKSVVYDKVFKLAEEIKRKSKRD